MTDATHSISATVSTVVGWKL